MAFVTRSGSALLLSGNPFKIVGANAQYLGLLESTPLQAMAYPSQFQIDDTINTAKEMGATVIRSHSLGISVGNALAIWPTNGTTNTAAYNTQNTLSTFANFAVALLLGAHNNNGSIGSFFNGNVTNFQIGTTSSTLYGSYALTENAGNTVVDASGQGNTGTLLGSMPQWTKQLTAGRKTLAPSTPTPIIIDTDCASDVDDIGAIAIAFRLQMLGYCTILGINVDTSNTNTPGAIDTIRKYLGQTQVPISSHALVGTFNPAGSDPFCPYLYSNFVHDVLLAASCPSPVTNMRTLLAARSQADVVVLGLGYANDLAALLASPADGISALTGIQLVTASVKQLVWTGGIYPTGTDPANFARDLTDAASVINNWPSPIIFFPGGAGGSSIGGLILTPNPLSSLSVLNPVKAAYQQYGSPDKGHSSWDLLTTMIGIEGLGAWSVVQGTNVLNTGTGVNTFTPGAGNHYYVNNNQPYIYYQNHLTELLKI